MAVLKHDLPQYTFSGPGCLSNYTVDLRKGMRCKLIPSGGTQGSYWIDEFPVDLFPRCSLIWHDAVHYGIVVSPEDVVDG